MVVYWAGVPIMFAILMWIYVYNIYHRELPRDFKWHDYRPILAAIGFSFIWPFVALDVICMVVFYWLFLLYELLDAFIKDVIISLWKK